MSWFRISEISDAERHSLARQFQAAQPFPHVVLDDVFAVSPDDIKAFPGPDWTGWTRSENPYQAGKMFCEDITTIPPPYADMIQELSGPPFLRFVELVTGIDRLLPDPYLAGGGLHLSSSGGVLAPHTDFHLYQELGLYRQVNVLVYFNENWPEDAGGALELWEKGADHPSVSVAPIWGRCVIFRTDDRSVHGFSRPVDDGLHRRSIALYYYTTAENETFSGDTTTYWQTHGSHHIVGRARLGLYRLLLLGARGLAMLAHRANPNIGLRRRR